MDRAEPRTGGSYVDKLLIKGIRSFSPDNKTSIDFYRPLTLIVGQNGAGKTTIIECLKQATTGDLPPNIKNGQAFIHDPKVAGETEVKACVKLRFFNYANKPIIAIRSFSLTQKGNKKEFKTLDSSINTKGDNSENIATAGRCGDIDRLVPEMMMVSKAVLENVIFVHQDESNWPLGDGATLKKKFDDIFSATRYTKALEAIRKLKSEQTAQIKEHKLKLETLETRANQAKRLRTNVSEDSEKAAIIANSMKEDEGALQGLRDKMDDLQTTAAQIQSLEEDVRGLKAQRDMKAAHTEELYNSMTEEIDEPIETIEKHLHDFEEMMVKMEQKAKNCELKVNRKKMEVETVRDNISSAGRAEMKLRAESELHESRIHKRAEDALRLKAQHPEISVPLAENATVAQVDAFVGSAAAHVQEMRGALDAHKQTAAAELERIAASQLEVQSQLQQSEAMAAAKAATRTKNQDKLAELAEQVRVLAVSDRVLEEVKRKEAEAKAALDEAVTKRQEAGLPQQIDTLKQELDTLGNKIYSLNRTRDHLSAASEEMQRLQLKVEEQAHKEDEAAVLLQSQRLLAVDRLAGADAPVVPETADEFATFVLDSLQATETQVAACHDELMAKQSSVATATARLRDAQSALRVKQERAGDLRRELMQGARAALGEVEDAWVDANGLKETLLQRDELLSEKIRKATEEADAEDAFVAMLEERIAQSPQWEADANAEVASARTTVDSLKALQPLFIQYDELKSSVLPTEEAKVLRLQQEEQAAIELQDVALSNQAEVDLKHQKLAPLKEHALTMRRLVSEAAALKAEITTLERRLPPSSTESRSVSAINSEIEGLEKQRNEVERKREDASQQRTTLDLRVSSLESQHRDAREAKMLADQKAQKLRDIQTTISDLQAANGALVTEVQQLEANLPALKERLAHVARESAAAREAAADKEKRLGSGLRELQREVDKLEEQTTALRQYEASNSSDQLNGLRQRTGELEAKLAAELEALDLLQTELKDKEAAVTSRESYKVLLESNLSWLRSKADLAQLESSLESQKQQLAGLGATGAVAQELATLRGESERLTKRVFTQRGTLDQLQANINKNKGELAVPQYKDIDEAYKSKRVELITTELANHDLDKYYKALDQTLMKFHNDKMQEINKIVKELWQQTYQGQDIDTIQIKADMEGTAGRSYNYRVVMRCGDADLEMRGRCSAGQKVLACLIIRLALAETFCHKCGILALDEPTTNLDLKNSEALARSLAGIMASRKDQKNFQLIVITHDEKFANMLGQREHAEYYWRVTKDANQNSHVEKQTIFE